MSSQPPVPRGLQQNSSPEKIPLNERRAQHRPHQYNHHPLDLNRPLPPPPASSLPNEYEIPTLRRKQVLDSASNQQLGHTRALSHPFPALFGGKKQGKKSQPKYDDLDSSDEGQDVTRATRNRTHSNNKTAPHNGSKKEPQTGKCMTCDSTVRWPQDLKIFRCTTCLTINDLQPFQAQESTSPRTRSNSTPTRTQPVSVEKTKRLLDLCIDEFFNHLLSNEFVPRQKVGEALMGSDDELPMSPAFPPTPTDPNMPPLEPPRPRFQDRSPSDPTFSRRHLPFKGMGERLTHVNHPRQTDSDELPSTPSQSRYPSRIIESEVFRPLEAYVASCFSGCAALNMSFFTTKPSNIREEKPLRPRQPKYEPIETITPASEKDIFLSDLDAKTLLLGDVVENGSWWMGQMDDRIDVQHEIPREKSPERPRGIVTSRSPRISWAELADWYRLIMHAGEDWLRRWNSMKSALSEPQLSKWKAVPLDYIHRNVMDSQVHLQRSLLKATENLLKRPRRPLTNPEDCRFLLMLLANPLLTSSSRQQQSPMQPESHENPASGVTTSPLRNTGAPRRNNSALGRHSGILKRIIGLIAYLSNDIHMHFVSWLSRFSDTHFAGIVELLGSFVTYRLTRQAAKPAQSSIDPTGGLIPSFANGGARHASEMHAAIEGRSQQPQTPKQDGKPKLGSYGEDWQIRAAARVMALLFQANTGHSARKRDTSISSEQRARSAGLNAKHQAFMHGQLIPISNFYNTMLDQADLVADFEAWETTKIKFTFCQYPFFLSIWAKIHILEHDARRQMESKAREAFFDSIMSRKTVSQFLVLRVRRDCLVEDSLKSVSEAIGRGGNDVKKGLRIDFAGEEGVDAGGLRKEWFLLLVREIFNPNHGLFVYDDESQYCYFNPFCLESSEQFFLVGVLLGLAIYNSTILDVAFPPFVFKKLLASAPPTSDKLTSTPKVSHQYTLEDLAELKPSLARGLRQLLEYDGDVEETFCRDFVIEMERYGGVVQIPLCPGGSTRPVTNENRREFVGMYIHYLLDQSVARQYEPFKRGFFTVCAGNALSLFRPEEIELLIRGSDEPLDVNSLRLVASYDGWPKDVVPEHQPQVIWFWEFFSKLSATDQRKLLSFITGSDRIPAMGTTNLAIRIQLLKDTGILDGQAGPSRLPIARTCFNLVGLYEYTNRATLEQKLWSAVTLSEGFGMK